MGQGDSKVMVNVPANITCFPYLPNEDELKSNCTKASSSLSEVRDLVCLASEMFLSPSQFTKARLLLSATSCLFNFILDRLSTKENNNSLSESSSSQKVDGNGNLPKKGNKSHTVKRTRPGNSLEEAFVQVKIDKAIANAAVAEFQAKIVAVKNRYDRMLSQISEDDRRLEVVPALTLCEEVLELFRDRSHVFWNNPLISAPFVVTFGGIYTAVGEISLLLIPSYRSPLNKQILCLQDTLVAYKTSCIRSRETSIKIRPNMPQNMIEGAVGGGGDQSFYVEDGFLNIKGQAHNRQRDQTPDPGNYRSFDDNKTAIQTYKKILEEKFDSFFEDVIHSVRSFSGFKHVNHRSSGQLNKQDDETNLQ